MAGLILQPMPATSYWTDSNNDGVPEEVADPPEGDAWWSDDSDGDNLTNAEEAAFLSDPYRLDSDFDGLTDKDERDLTPPVLFGGLAHTDPWDWDSDDDGYSDHDEYFYTLQNRSPDVHYPSLAGGAFYSYYDADGDGLHNQEDPDPASMDRDGDGILNWQDSYMDDYYNGNPPPTAPWFYADNDNDGTINGNDPYPDDPWNGQPHYYWNGSEHPGTWSDQDGDGIPDDFDPLPVPGYTYNGIFYSGDWSDRDNDGVPDPADPSPDGTYWYSGHEYPGPWADTDNDGIPDAADPIDSTNSHWYNGTEYSGPFTDTDGDSIPDSADSWPSDPENGYDADGDGLDNYTETHNTQTNPNDVDSDDDYLTDGEEALVTHTNPNDPTTGASQTQLDFFVFSGPDTDSDGLPDLVEKHYASDPSASNAATWLTPSGDLDGDGVTNMQAYWFGWDLLAYLNQYDMDGDGMTDAQEDYWNARYPGIMDKAVFADGVADPDGDGLMNYEELGMGTSPGNARSLSSAVVDGQLLVWQRYTSTPRQWGYDWSLMLDPWSTPAYLPCPEIYLENNDWDGNGLPDGYDAYVATNGAPPTPPPVPADADGDGMSNLWEWRFRLNPRDSRDAQTPGPSSLPEQPQPQSFVDWESYSQAYPEGGGQPLNYLNVGDFHAAYQTYVVAFEAAANVPPSDPDLDGLTNLAEFQYQTHPRIADTDGDGDSDGYEIIFGSLPNDPTRTLADQLEALRDEILAKIADLDQALETGASHPVFLQYYDELTALNEALINLWKAARWNPQTTAALDAIGGIDGLIAAITTALMKLEDEPLPEARTRALFQILDDQGASTRTGYWTEKPYENPPPGRSPPYIAADFWEPIVPGYANPPFGPWQPEARGHGTPFSTGFSPVAQAFTFGPDEEDNEFSYTQMRLHRSRGMEETHRFFRLRYVRSWYDASGAYHSDISRFLVMLGMVERADVSTFGQLTPIFDSGNPPPGISLTGGVLTMAPPPEVGVHKEVFLEPVAGPLVRLYKEGAAPSSGNPMVVARGERMVCDLDPNDSELLPVSIDELRWETSQLNHNGKWLPYIEIGSGQPFHFETPTPGIFRLRARINRTMTINLARTSNDAFPDPISQKPIKYGFGRVGSPDAFGVVSKPLQKQIWAAARTHLLSQKFAKNQHVAAEHGFGSVAVGAYKCNIYVAHSAVEGGAAVPAINGFLLKNDPPRASQWAGVEDTDPGTAGLQVNLAGWHNPDTSSNPEPGIVISYGGAPGHCGILDYDGFGLSASSEDDPPLNIVTRRLTIRAANSYRYPNQ